jgi:hypothetical protein
MYIHLQMGCSVVIDPYCTHTQGLEDAASHRLSIPHLFMCDSADLRILMILSETFCHAVTKLKLPT